MTGETVPWENLDGMSVGLIAVEPKNGRYRNVLPFLTDYYVSLNQSSMRQKIEVIIVASSAESPLTVPGLRVNKEELSEDFKNKFNILDDSRASDEDTTNEVSGGKEDAGRSEEEGGDENKTEPAMGSPRNPGTSNRSPATPDELPSLYIIRNDGEVLRKVSLTPNSACLDEWDYPNLPFFSLS